MSTWLPLTGTPAISLAMNNSPFTIQHSKTTLGDSNMTFSQFLCIYLGILTFWDVFITARQSSTWQALCLFFVASLAEVQGLRTVAVYERNREVMRSPLPPRTARSRRP